MLKDTHGLVSTGRKEGREGDEGRKDVRKDTSGGALWKEGRKRKEGRTMKDDEGRKEG
jgi:hypothetical protein